MKSFRKLFFLSFAIAEKPRGVFLRSLSSVAKRITRAPCRVKTVEGIMKVFEQYNPTRQNIEYVVPGGMQRRFAMTRVTGRRGGEVYTLVDLSTLGMVDDGDCVITVPPTPIQCLTAHAGIACDRRIVTEVNFPNDRRRDGFRRYRVLLNGHEPLVAPWMQARIEHLAAYGAIAVLPERVTDRWVIALGSSLEIGGRVCVPLLHEDRKEGNQIRFVPQDDVGSECLALAVAEV